VKFWSSAYDYVDGLSLHRYFGNTAEDTGGDSAKFLAMNLSMERQIAETVCGLRSGARPQALTEEAVGSRSMNGTFGIGPQRGCGERSRAGIPSLLEEVYNLEDALLVGGLINSLIRNADRVKLACLAQLNQCNRSHHDQLE